MVKSKKRASDAFLSDENTDTRNTQLTIYIAKRDVIFKRLENIYDLAQRAEQNPQNYKALCASASNIDKLRDNYEEILSIIDEARKPGEGPKVGSQFLAESGCNCKFSML